MLKKVIHNAHDLIQEAVQEGDTVIDATCGNGHDTLFLSNLVGETGKVLAFDIQEQALTNTAERLQVAKWINTTLIQDSHANMDHYLSNDLKGKVGAAIFNLGYLPKGDKAIITKGNTTIKAIQTLLEYLKINGLINIVIYYGHEGGQEEKDAVLEFVKNLDQKRFSVLRYEFINQQNNPPFLIAIQKRQ
ncbi:class I SAM-dependent methyltransferase [Oceanobacillus halotolerans]|uniref:class I SAM-dependent methyltransferase n=1 Tax=Oceanobacillus halotolerans TaxID=2663380 RepID=UPI0013DB1F03|nr:class I SAM-dependent methyltransferase [Oceanobacillus halotolerans]